MLIDEVLGQGSAMAAAIRAANIPPMDFGLSKIGVVNPPFEDLYGELMGASDVLSMLDESESGPSAAATDSLGIDAGLWDFIKGAADPGEWDHVASGAVRYVEHHLRAWAEASSEADAPGLVNALFGKGAPLALGDNEGQRQGWESIIRGFLMGPRNEVQHGISDRDDLHRFASGVLGTASLILTEVRRRYPDRFGSG
jgi:hypothetical protein